MIRTWHRAATGAAAPLFDPDVEHPREELLDPLLGPVPTWRMTESPLFDDAVVEHGDPGTLDERVVALPAAEGDVVKSDAQVVDPDDREVDEDDGEDEHPRASAPTVVIALPATAALPLVERPRRSLRTALARAPRREPRRVPA